MIKHHKKLKEQEVLFNNGIIKTPYTGRLFVETIFEPSTEGGSVLFATYGLDKIII